MLSRDRLRGLRYIVWLLPLALGLLAVFAARLPRAPGLKATGGPPAVPGALPPFIFVHMGDDPAVFPDFFAVAVHQVAKWNAGADVHVVVPRAFTARASVLEAARAPGATVRVWALEDVPRTPLHENFARKSSLDTSFRSGFIRHTTERLFVLLDVLAALGADEALHQENDNLLYFDVRAALPTLRARYPGLAVEPHHLKNERRDGGLVCTAGFLYVGRRGALEDFLATGDEGQNEMVRLGDYAWRQGDVAMGLLPVIAETVMPDHPEFSRNLAALGGLFDGASHGQYLGGVDPRNNVGGPGWVNLDAPYRVDAFEYDWHADPASGLRRAYTRPKEGGGAWLPLFQLHIHSKNLAAYAS